MKAISYSIFRGDCEEFEFKAYLRGLYFNFRMNELIYPDWKMCLHVEEKVYKEHLDYIVKLTRLFDVDMIVLESAPLCQMMLWRMYPIYSGMYNNYTHVLCRDSDALTTYREAKMIHLWALNTAVNTGASLMCIWDNPSHAGLMGGMTAFKSEAIRHHFPTFSSLVKGFDLNKRGSDQNLLNQRVYPLFKDRILFEDHRTDYNKTGVFEPKTNLPGVDGKLWESNLCTSFIGSAGFNELETLRFFKRFDKRDFTVFEKEFINICYWAQ